MGFMIYGFVIYDLQRIVSHIITIGEEVLWIMIVILELLVSGM